jgi:hypothetical protein
MKQRPRIYYSEVQKAMMWDRWQRGESLSGKHTSGGSAAPSIFCRSEPRGLRYQNL